MGVLQAFGDAKPVSEFINTALRVRQGDTQAKLADMQIQQEQMKLKKMQAQEAIDNAPYNMNFDPLLTTYEAGTPEHAQLKSQLWSASGADEHGNTTFAKRSKGLQVFTQDTAAMKGVYEARFGKIQNEYIATMEALDQAKAIGDEEKVAKLQAKSENLAKRGAAASTGWVQYLSAAEKTKQAQEATDAKTALDERKADVSEGRLAEMERSNQAKETAMDRRLSVMEKNADTTAKKAESSGKDLSFADKEALRSMGKQLPKTKIAAETASKNVAIIDRMLGLIDKGAGGVRGELLAKINKVADVFRVTPPEDAKYNQLKAELRGFAGKLRLQLGLVGQTSDRDVEIMYGSAGGNTPAEAQKAILSGYRQQYLQDITNYNSDAEAYAGYSRAGGNLYKPIPLPTAGVSGPQIVETRKTKDGRILEKLSDGTIREKK